VNRVWNTHFENFDQIIPPPLKEAEKNRALWYDWVFFNQYRFTEYLKWLRDEVKKIDPNSPVAAAGTSVDVLGTYYPLSGIDMEAIITEVCDVVKGEVQSSPLYTDLLRSFAEGGKPIGDFEYHGDVSGILPHFLHGTAALSMWVWMDRAYPDNISAMSASIPHSWRVPMPVVSECLRTALDLRRLGKEITSFPQARREIAILYSKTTMLQTPPRLVVQYSRYTPYLVELRRSYVANQFTDAYRDFISENQIAEGNLQKYRILIIPGVSHMREPVFKKILSFVKEGRITTLSPQSLLYDECHRGSDYLHRLGVRVKKMVNPPPVQIKGLLESDQAFLQNYFERAGLLDGEQRNIQWQGRLPLSGRGTPLVSMGPEQRVTVEAEHRVLATFSDGTPAIFSLLYGKGEMYYLASALSPQDYARVVDSIIEAQGVVRSTGENLWGVEARAVTYGDAHLLYLSNFDKQEEAAFLKPSFPVAEITDLRTMEKVESENIQLGPHETRLFSVAVKGPKDTGR
jgi:beta-galactosidase GanA